MPRYIKLIDILNSLPITPLESDETNFILLQLLNFAYTFGKVQLECELEELWGLEFELQNCIDDAVSSEALRGRIQLLRNDFNLRTLSLHIPHPTEIDANDEMDMEIAREEYENLRLCDSANLPLLRDQHGVFHVIESIVIILPTIRNY